MENSTQKMNRIIQHGAEKKKFISQKVEKIMNEGVRGKKVPVKQAVAIAYSYAKKK